MKPTDQFLLKCITEGSIKITAFSIEDEGYYFDLIDETGENETELLIDFEDLNATFSDDVDFEYVTVGDLIEDFTGVIFEVLKKYDERLKKLDCHLKITDDGVAVYSDNFVVRELFGVSIPSSDFIMTQKDFEEWLDKVEIAAQNLEICKDNLFSIGRDAIENYHPDEHETSEENAQANKFKKEFHRQIAELADICGKGEFLIENLNDIRNKLEEIYYDFCVEWLFDNYDEYL